jgi:hypothetical protein
MNVKKVFRKAVVAEMKRISRNRGKIEELDYVRPTTHEFVTDVYTDNMMDEKVVEQ